MQNFIPYYINVNCAQQAGAFPGRVQILWHFPYQYAIIYLPVGNFLDKANIFKYTGVSFRNLNNELMRSA
jgi:hypothetical protein